MTTIDQKIVEFINQWTVGANKWPIGNLILCFIAIILSVFLCGAIGFEREVRGRSAGLRTHLLVGVGSCIIMIISIYGFPKIIQDGVLFDRDVARLAAQVVAGVGFLGAGAIIHRNSGVRGLTTAGTIWVAMAIGLACGSMNFILASFTTLVILVVLIFFRKVEAKISERNPTITIISNANNDALSKVMIIARDVDCSIQGINTSLIEDSGTDQIEITFQAVFNNPNMVNVFISRIEQEIKPESVQVLSHNRNK